MLSRIFAVIVFTLTMSQIAHAADRSGQFSVRGAGLLSCATFNAEREKKSVAYQMIGGWIDGYISGANASLEETFDLMTYRSTEMVAEIVHRHCTENPQHRLSGVLAALTRQVHAERLEVASTLHKVVVGEQQALLYAATIYRLQANLAARGLMAADLITGEYSAHTARALRDFQAANEFVATGFPDQATLWLLFESS